jgi:hypothetical protein
MLPYNIYDVGVLHSSWEVRESPDLVSKTKYVWKREEQRNWNLTDPKEVLVAQFDKCMFALTKIGKLYFTGQGDWLEHEIIVATIRAVEMYIQDR